MDRIEYVVTAFQDRWFVVLQGKRHGPYESQRAAIEDAIRGAQTVPNSQVLVETAGDAPRTEWTHGSDPERYPPRA
jgi:predicted metalloprotease